MSKIQKSGEDYLEAIYVLSQRQERVRSIDVARALKVSRPSVFNALQILLEQGCIQKEEHGAITLTKQGAQIARSVLAKHRAIRMLLIDVLGVSAEAAEVDACRIEHCLGAETTKKLFAFLNIEESED